MPNNNKANHGLVKGGEIPRILFGYRLGLFRFKHRLSMVKYLLHKNRYPLFILSPSKGGLLKTIRILRKMKFNKVVKLGKRYFISLSVPHWPSKPFESMVGKGGLNVTASGTPFKQQVDIVFLAITRKCKYQCKHCYEHFNLSGKEAVSVGRWKEIVKELQETGVNIITLTGGEPMLRYDALVEILDSGDKDRSDFHVHTSGNGVSKKRAFELAKAGLAAAGIGIDDPDPSSHDILRGYSGAFQEAVQALHDFQDAGVFTYLNVCLTKNLVRSGRLQKLLELAKDHHVGMVRLLEPKPCGGYCGENRESLFSAEDRRITEQFFTQANTLREYKDHPMVAYPAYSEALERMGCIMGGLSHFYIDSLGNVEPCVFVPVSFGNIMREDFSSVFGRMRKAVPRPLHSRCPSLFFAQTIKKNQSLNLPIPFGNIEREWCQMWSESASGSY